MSKDWASVGRADDGIDAIVNRLLVYAGQANVARPDVFKFIECLGGNGKLFDGLKLKAVSDDDLPGAKAEARVAERIIVARQSTIEAAKNNQWWACFALFHEVGHIVLDHKGAPKQKAFGKVETLSGIVPYRRVERQADVFALCCLMPLNEVLSCNSAEEVAEKFHAPLTHAFDRFQAVQKRYVGKETPPDVLKQIEKQKAEFHISTRNNVGVRHEKAIAQLKRSCGVSDRQPQSPVYSRSIQIPFRILKKWDQLEHFKGHDPEKWRVTREYAIRKDLYLIRKPGGWGEINGHIRSYEELGLIG